MPHAPIVLQENNLLTQAQFLLAHVQIVRLVLRAVPDRVNAPHALRGKHLLQQAAFVQIVAEDKDRM